MSNRDDKDTYIKIYRKIQYNWLWEDKPFSNGQAWIDLLIIAKRFDGPFTDKKHRSIEGKRGCVYCSINYLADRWGWNRKRVSAFLDALERENMIKVCKKRGSDRTSLCIVNYDDYQIGGTTQGTGKRTTQGQLKDNSGTTQGHIKESNNNTTNKGKRKPSAQSSDEDPSKAIEEDEGEETDFSTMTDEEFEEWRKQHK